MIIIGPTEELKKNQTYLSQYQHKNNSMNLLFHHQTAPEALMLRGSLAIMS